MDQIISFNGEFSFLSNFYPGRVNVYKSAEAAYQAQKCENPDDRKQFIPLDAGHAKRLGRRVSVRPGWDEMRVDVMRDVVHTKFRSNPDLAEKLLATEDAELIEGNCWHDNFFGDCLCRACAKTPGENWLGKILMDERSALKADAAK